MSLHNSRGCLGSKDVEVLPSLPTSQLSNKFCSCTFTPSGPLLRSLLESRKKAEEAHF